MLDAPLLAAAIATHLALAAALTAFAALTLLWSLHTQASPERVARSRFDRTLRACTRSFSLLVPARHEEGSSRTRSTCSPPRRTRGSR